MTDEITEIKRQRNLAIKGLDKAIYWMVEFERVARFDSKLRNFYLEKIKEMKEFSKKLKLNN
jgi:hypothetical protein